MNKKVLKKVGIFGCIIVVFIALLYAANNFIFTSKYEYKSSKITKDLDGFNIVHLSDLHNKSFGKNNKILVSKVRKLNPDIIVITGDIVDSHNSNTDVAEQLAKELTKLAPVYYTNGNHEVAINSQSAYGYTYGSQDDDISIALKRAGVKVLYNKAEMIRDNLCIIGLDEADILNDNADNVIKDIINKEDIGKDVFKILLAHEPQLIKDYSAVDMVYAGHAHGGQFRLPFINIGLVAPNQGFFPKYTSGRYDYKNTTMYVSRGLGNSIIPIRIFNNPEIISVRLVGIE